MIGLPLAETTIGIPSTALTMPEFAVTFIV